MNVDNAYAPVELVLPRQLGLLRPVDLRAVPRRRRSSRASWSCSSAARRVAWAALGARRRDVARARAVVLAVELRRARRRDRRRARRALAPARAPAARRSRPRRSRVVTLGVPQMRHRILGKAGLVARDERPLEARLERRQARRRTTRVVGVGAGGFKRGYANLTGLKGKEPKAAASHDDADHGRGRDGPARARAARLAGRRRRSSLPFRRTRSRPRRPRPPRLRTSLDRDRRAQPLLQRALRGPALLGAARARRRVARSGSRA